MKTDVRSSELKNLHYKYSETDRIAFNCRRTAVILVILSLLALGVLIAHRITNEYHDTCSSIETFVLIISLTLMTIGFFLCPIFIYIESRSTEGMLRCKNALKHLRTTEEETDYGNGTDEYEASEQNENE